MTEMWLELMGQFKTLYPFQDITGRTVKLICQLDLKRAHCQAAGLHSLAVQELLWGHELQRDILAP